MNLQIIKALTPLILAFLGSGLEAYAVAVKNESVQPVAMVLVGAAAGLANPTNKNDEPK